MYLDPGFGGMLVQALVAIVAVGGGILFSFRKKIRATFSKSKDNTNAKIKQTTGEVKDDVVDTLSEKE